jgi:hypothetical protein
LGNDQNAAFAAKKPSSRQIKGGVLPLLRQENDLRLAAASFAEFDR